jgi:hypothetical protein
VSELAYLGLAVIVSIIGSIVVWHRQRRPHSLESGIEEFSAGLHALGSADGETGFQERGRRTG